MKKLLLTMILLCGALMAQDKAEAKPADTANQPALTIYNQNFFVAREYVPLDLTFGGESPPSWCGDRLPPGARFRYPARPRRARSCRCWNRITATILSPQELLLSFYEGKTIEFLGERQGRTPLIS